MFKSFFANQGLGQDYSAVSAWAKRRAHQFKREKEGNGFVIDGQLEGKPWRLEWGPPQRPYIEGHEMRLRMELGLPQDLQMLIMSKPLMERLEKEVFEQFTQSNQTEMGVASPEEMRWLVMFPKFAFNGSKTLRAAYGGVSGLPTEGPAWIAGPLEHALERATSTLFRLQPPVVLMTLRGRMYLRMQMPDADEIDIAAALDLFETAGTQAIRVGAARLDEARAHHEPRLPEPRPGEPPTFAPTTIETAWQTLDPVKPK